MARYSKKLVNKSNFKNRSKNSTRNRKPKSRQTRAKKIIKKNKKTIRRKFKGGAGAGADAGEFCKLDNENKVILDFSIQPPDIYSLYAEILKVLEDKLKASNLLAGIYQSEFLFELFLIIVSEKSLINDNDNDLTTEHDTFIKSAVKSYKKYTQNGGSHTAKPIYNTAQIRNWGSEVIDHLKVVPLEEPSIEPPAQPLRQPRSHFILTYTPPSGSHPPVTLNLRSKLPNLKKLRKKMKLGFKSRYINSMLIEGTPLHTIEEDPREEHITYAQDEHDEIVELENKIKDISLHILENIFKDISIKSAPSGDTDASKSFTSTPAPAPRPFYTFSFAKRVEILGSKL